MEDMQVSNVSEEVVTPQIDENIETASEEVTENVEETTAETEGAEEEVAEPQEVEKPVQTAEQNAMFAKIRREAEQRARDSVIADMGMEWNGKPIKTHAEYQQALKEKQYMEEAEKQGLDPQFYSDFKTMQEELNAYKRNSEIAQQEVALANDPLVGDFYKEWKDEVHEMANQYGCDLDTAFTFLTRSKLGEILNKNTKKIQNETITKINTNQKTTPGALGAAIDQPSTNAWDMNEADFNSMMEKAMRGELKRY